MRLPRTASSISLRDAARPAASGPGIVLHLRELDEQRIDDFLERKLPELLPERGGAIPQAELLPAFLTVNRDRRKQAEETKRTLAAKTQPRPLWDGAFVQPRNTKVFSNFDIDEKELEAMEQ